MEEKLKLNKKDIIIYSKNNLVVLYNKKILRHIILTKEVYDYFLAADDNALTIKSFLDKFLDKEDREYMKSMTENMIKAGALIVDEQRCNAEVNLLKYFYISLTNRCNLSCSHCCSSCSPNEKDILSTGDIMTIVDKLKHFEPRYIVLTGGEPLIRNDFKEIVSYIRSVFPSVNLALSTNSILINDENIDFIVKNFNKIDISIDGVDEETCSIVRGRGVFGKVISSIQNLQNKGFINISLSMVLGEKNEHLKYDFRKLNYKLGTTPIERSFTPIGRGKENVLDFYYDNTDLPMEIVKIFSDTNKKSKKIGSCSCDAFKEQLYISYDGNVYPCPSLIKDEYCLGNILSCDINQESIMQTEARRSMEKIYPFNYEKCKDCDVNIFCWHCPALIDSVKDNEVDFNRWCSCMKPQLNRIIWDEEY